MWRREEEAVKQHHKLHLDFEGPGLCNAVQPLSNESNKTKREKKHQHASLYRCIIYYMTHGESIESIQNYRSMIAVLLYWLLCACSLIVADFVCVCLFILVCVNFLWILFSITDAFHLKSLMNDVKKRRSKNLQIRNWLYHLIEMQIRFEP